MDLTPLFEKILSYMPAPEGDENGELQLQLDIPPKAKSVEIMIYNYTDESTGTVVQLDKSLVELAEVVRQEG